MCLCVLFMYCHRVEEMYMQSCVSWCPSSSIFSSSSPSSPVPHLNTSICLHPSRYYHKSLTSCLTPHTHHTHTHTNTHTTYTHKHTHAHTNTHTYTHKHTHHTPHTRTHTTHNTTHTTRTHTTRTHTTHKHTPHTHTNTHTNTHHTQTHTNTCASHKDYKPNQCSSLFVSCIFIAAILFQISHSELQW